MIQHPTSVLPADAQAAAYEAIVAELAANEPLALARAAVAIQARSPEAANVARAWIAFSGHVTPVSASPRGKVHSFGIPAWVGFDMAGSADETTALQRARSAITALIATDQPLFAVPGHLPEDPSIFNVEVWLGKVTDIKLEP